MKKFLIPCLLIMCMIFSATSVSAYPSLTDHPNVAVMKFVNKAAVSKEIDEMLAQKQDKLGDTSRISEYLIKSLIKTQRFLLVERENSLQISGELEYSQSGLVNTSDAATVGKQKSAHYMIFGSLTGLSTKESGISGSGSGFLKVTGTASVSKKTVVADIIFRIVNVETGEIILSVDGRGTSARADAKLSINKNNKEVYEADTSENSDTPNITQGAETSSIGYTVNIGSEKFSAVQVENAIKEAVKDAIQNKKYGLLAELNGTAEE